MNGEDTGCWCIDGIPIGGGGGGENDEKGGYDGDIHGIGGGITSGCCCGCCPVIIFAMGDGICGNDTVGCIEI